MKKLKSILIQIIVCLLVSLLFHILAITFDNFQKKAEHDIFSKYIKYNKEDKPNINKLEKWFYKNPTLKHLNTTNFMNNYQKDLNKNVIKYLIYRLTGYFIFLNIFYMIIIRYFKKNTK